MGHRWHLEQGVCTFSYTFYALLGVASNCRHKSELFRSLSSLTSPEYGNVGLSSSTAANLKAFIILLSPHHYMLFKLFPFFRKLIHIRDVAKDLYAIMWL